ncbi:MAG TPA: DUF4112 domain-containing protein [Polyangiaceae bacterium]|nr:DUF4112 domain-containing protein [Polyangiaceae bacterium]
MTPNRIAPPTNIPPWAKALVRLLDRAFVLPGTQIEVGLDPILGLFAPGAGDLVGALATLSLLHLGFKLRVPRVILLRMLLNVAIDAIVGSIPVLGDAFDLFYRAAQKNLALIEKHGGAAPQNPSFGDYAVVGLAVVVAIALLALPVLAGFGLLYLTARWVGR